MLIWKDVELELLDFSYGFVLGYKMQRYELFLK